MNDLFDEFYSLPEFIYRIVRACDSCDSIHNNVRLIALAILSYRYSNKFLKLTNPTLHHEIPILNSEQLSDITKKIEEAILSYKIVYSKLDEDVPVYPLIKHIYLDLGIDVKKIKKMYKVLNKKLQPLINLLKLSNIAKYEFGDEFGHLKIYSVKPLDPKKKYEERFIASKDISIFISLVESQEMLLSLTDRVIANIIPIINNTVDSHHC